MGYDHHEGQRVSRRRVIAGISSVGLAGLLAACGRGSGTVTTSTGATAAPQATTANDLTALFDGVNTCTLTASTTQGPYYFDADKIRSDIREDREGTLLRLAIRVQDSEQCGPLPNAVVEIWHCDAAGLYSGAEAQSSGANGASGGGTAPGGGAPSGAAPGGGVPSGAAPGGGPGGAPGGSPGGGDTRGGDMGDLTPTDDQRYLRGAQVTNADGIVEFTTIWPGWYRGRTVHIHAMVHLDNARVLTSQVMFDEALNSKIYASQPYAAHTGRDTFNDNDSIYADSMLLTVREDGDGYLGVINFGVDSDQDGT
ncbi:intradiol ring-cleavage dioxygenase [Micromonospora radicis]|uniref:Protocatechuate dioxygenase n=1 Tax=Micromonospora radicis TaxID=1894971 RepID=A0A418MPK9_9ACTN|nr:intradiol ring-cleavage dioxygenase [Micromonospora radicis]RIV34442.1 protocatechuate dioxygenase [Micromonospora radicis]